MPADKHHPLGTAEGPCHRGFDVVKRVRFSASGPRRGLPKDTDLALMAPEPSRG
jgi:hypothetical protein